VIHPGVIHPGVFHPGVFHPQTVAVANAAPVGLLCVLQGGNGGDGSGDGSESEPSLAGPNGLWDARISAKAQVAALLKSLQATVTDDDVQALFRSPGSPTHLWESVRPRVVRSVAPRPPHVCLSLRVVSPWVDSTRVDSTRVDSTRGDSTRGDSPQTVAVANAAPVGLLCVLQGGSGGDGSGDGSESEPSLAGPNGLWNVSTQRWCLGLRARVDPAHA
jgi:hypothetical protein